MLSAIEERETRGCEGRGGVGGKCLRPKYYDLKNIPSIRKAFPSWLRNGSLTDGEPVEEAHQEVYPEGEHLRDVQEGPGVTAHLLPGGSALAHHARRGTLEEAVRA